MFFFSFINRKFWWPKKRRWFLKKFLSFIRNDKRKSKSFFYLKSKEKLFRSSRRRFYSLFSKQWLFFRISKYRLRPLVPFRFVKKKICYYNLPFHTNEIFRFANIILRFTINNIFVTVCDENFRILTYYSSGLVGFSGPTKTTSFALERIVDTVSIFLKKRFFKNVHLFVLSGMFNYRSKLVLDSLSSKNLIIRAITYKINNPHNGIRARKMKRR
jgi:small subunit ribosomal protein S11